MKRLLCNKSDRSVFVGTGILSLALLMAGSFQAMGSKPPVKIGPASTKIGSAPTKTALAATKTAPALPRVSLLQVAAAPAHGVSRSETVLHPEANPPQPLTVQPMDDGYTVNGRGFKMHLARNGELSDITCGGRPLFDRAYLEIRDKTWHMKLSPRPEQAQMSSPRAEKDGQRFHYTIQMADTATNIQLAVDETVTVKNSGEIQIVLNIVPQVQFEAHRISWNTELAADRFANTAYSWQCKKEPQSTMQFPKQQAPDPHLAKDFEWMRVNCGGGPVDIRFSTSGPKDKSLDVENVLEDLRWWSNPRFWIADAAPYPHQDGDRDKVMQVPPGEARTLRINIVLHCANAS